MYIRITEDKKKWLIDLVLEAGWIPIAAMPSKEIADQFVKTMQNADVREESRPAPLSIDELLKVMSEDTNEEVIEDETRDDKIMRMFKIEGRQRSEIAELTGWSYGTVCTIIRRNGG